MSKKRWREKMEFVEVEIEGKEEPVFEKSEFIANAEKVLGVRREVAVGALHSAKDSLTVSEAQRLVKEFLNKEVK